MTKMNRRAFVTGSVAAAAAVTGGGLAARAALEPAGPASAHIATVVAHEGAFATVTGASLGADAPRRLALKGFPVGWKLRRGDTVFIGDGSDSHFVEPLSAPVIGEVRGPLARDDYDVSIGNTTIAIQKATVIDTREDGTTSHYVAHCISNQDGLAPACLAIRSA